VVVRLVCFGTWLYVWYVLLRHCTFANSSKRGFHLLLSIIVTELLWRGEVSNVPSDGIYSIRQMKDTSSNINVHVVCALPVEMTRRTPVVIA
jgi:hypothetical protein